MDKDEIIEYLKENLEISLSVEKVKTNYFENGRDLLEVTLYLDGEEISKSSLALEEIK
jgi:hypothetical protein